MPALAPYIVEPIWEQVCALLPERDDFWIAFPDVVIIVRRLVREA